MLPEAGFDVVLTFAGAAGADGTTDVPPVSVPLLIVDTPPLALPVPALLPIPPAILPPVPPPTSILPPVPPPTRLAGALFEPREPVLLANMAAPAGVDAMFGLYATPLPPVVVGAPAADSIARTEDDAGLRGS